MNISTTQRPWGSFTRFTHNESSTVKLLYIKKGEETSLQYHLHREEFWKIIEGHPEITIDISTHTAAPGDEFHISPHINHRIAAPQDDVMMLEISMGDFDEEDIVRVSDKYNRVP